MTFSWRNNTYQVRFVPLYFPFHVFLKLILTSSGSLLCSRGAVFAPRDLVSIVIVTTATVRTCEECVTA